jgi:hypothetical protein
MVVQSQVETGQPSQRMRGMEEDAAVMVPSGGRPSGTVRDKAKRAQQKMPTAKRQNYMAGNNLK